MQLNLYIFLYGNRMEFIWKRNDFTHRNIRVKAILPVMLLGLKNWNYKRKNVHAAFVQIRRMALCSC